ncbi:dephospho-CoA kinase [Aliidiomarina sedimenti]|uniref:Dephospho-CoA kinase n=1 Tax=Aliidiomarina sedimenti TaxID=1933879 RepID=A0ABY0BZG6_9GAMM|nr:dephospho-CoA kinase [Aliidiomarina sedimenti]RUO30556.1 dephospho-CoA kinase [Aliidiomarina sedimenti]
MSNFVVGVTGGIGSGKTTVTDAFAAKGIPVIDADVIAREMVAAGSDSLSDIARHFGPDILTAQGELDRAQLRQRIFADETEKEWLNQLLHPRIRHAIETRLNDADATYCILSAPLLLENKLTYLTDRVLVVDVPESLQIERTMARDNNSEAQVEAIIAAQMPRQQRLAQADDVLSNDGTVADVYDQVEVLHQQYLQAAASKRQQ